VNAGARGHDSSGSWQERPLAALILQDSITAEASELCIFLEQKFARWQVPDSFVFVSELPHTATGKVLKTKLRLDFNDWRWEMF
jgi:fatty-acyl-CoA synthase